MITEETLEKANYKISKTPDLTDRPDFGKDGLIELTAYKKHRGFLLRYSTTFWKEKQQLSQLQISMSFKDKDITILSWCINPEETIEEVEDYFETFFKQLEKY